MINHVDKLPRDLCRDCSSGEHSSELLRGRSLPNSCYKHPAHLWVPRQHGRHRCTADEGASFSLISRPGMQPLFSLIVAGLWAECGLVAQASSASHRLQHRLQHTTGKSKSAFFFLYLGLAKFRGARQICGSVSLSWELRSFAAESFTETSSICRAPSKVEKSGLFS